MAPRLKVRVPSPVERPAKNSIPGRLLELIELAEFRGLPVAEFGNDNGRLYVKTQGLADTPVGVQNAPQGSGETAAARWIREKNASRGRGGSSGS